VAVVFPLSRNDAVATEPVSARLVKVFGKLCVLMIEPDDISGEAFSHDMRSCPSVNSILVTVGFRIQKCGIFGKVKASVNPLRSSGTASPQSGAKKIGGYAAAYG